MNLSTPNVTFRMAETKDAASILAIYEPYILETSVTFETEVPSLEDFTHRIAHYLETLPYIICEIDGEIAGYAYASRFRERAAYDWDVETSIYVNEDYHRGGVGTLLYRTLLKILEKMNYVHAYACITIPNPQSIGFHGSLGFEMIGRFPDSGFKAGAWHDICWMDYRIKDTHASKDVKPVLNIKELPGEELRALFEDASNELSEKLDSDMSVLSDFLSLLQ